LDATNESELLQRIKAKRLKAEDYDFLKQMVGSYNQLLRLLKEEDAAIDRFQAMVNARTRNGRRAPQRRGRRRDAGASRR
jgi:hypothetical protein